MTPGSWVSVDETRPFRVWDAYAQAFRSLPWFLIRKSRRVTQYMSKIFSAVSHLQLLSVHGNTGVRIPYSARLERDGEP